jgi:hypothetical protein
MDIQWVSLEKKKVKFERGEKIPSATHLYNLQTIKRIGFEDKFNNSKVWEL